VTYTQQRLPLLRDVQKDTSLGLDDIVKVAYNNGLVVVSAAGNSNIDACGISPARSPYGITVGATTKDDAKAFFSNYGGCVNIWAPGLYIPSSFPSSNNGYAVLSGTSQATPHVRRSLVRALARSRTHVRTHAREHR
jgi:subtilisin family serine protease